MVSKEVVDVLKAQLAQSQTALASLRAHKDSVDAASRQFINETFTDNSSYVASIADKLPPMQKQILDNFKQRIDDMPSIAAEKLDQEMPLAVLVHAASANAKQLSQERINTQEKDDELRKALQKIDEQEAEITKQRRINSDYVNVINEKQEQTVALSQKLAVLTGTANRADFRIPTSRVQGLANDTATAVANLAAAHVAAQPPAVAEPAASSTTVDVDMSAADKAVANAAARAAEAGIPSTIETGGAAKALNNGKAPMQYTQMVHNASARSAAGAAHPTPEGFASYVMQHGNGSGRVYRVGAESSNKLLGADGSDSSSIDNASIEAAIRAAAF